MRCDMTGLKDPIALLPMIMSGAAFITILVYLILNGPAPQSDEGTAAHVWQILMAAQIPLILFFAIKWFPRSPAVASCILIIQLGAALMAMAPVYLLRW